MAEAPLPGMKRYYVDEAGDPTLFAAGGRVVVGTEGCSKFFILGVLDVASSEAVSAALAELRARLLADPWFRRVPSMQAGAGKTAVCFHAKDDVEEVRREVFRLLSGLEVRFHAVVRDKRAVMAYVRQRNERDVTYRYHPNELYDALVQTLFRDRLRKGGRAEICFAKRGSSDRTKSLRDALYQARPGLPRAWEYDAAGSPWRVTAASSAHSPPLQAADYFLWATQRWFERGQARYLEYVWPRVVVLHAMDEATHSARGVFFTQRNPIAFNDRKDAGI